ncbi:thiamine-phosphate kinase [Bryocella elongata]|uniref:Thiamine-monophosphate kinase n=1 Tax=Bryocella elongata TaxID=863522 RepID=A0A1H5WIV1_9BACT|nr:thiamine-phosphate kinase [Bryocella elongata]SEF99559.1 thiamine-phosphate kinase [Bryocella elongata]
MAVPRISGELALIDRIRRRTEAQPSRALRLGIGDDCAILRVPRGQELVVTTDFSLEGRHFRRDWHTPQSIGHRTLARGLSDLAAMGATPLAAFLSLALPKSAATDTRFLDGFLEGLLTLAKLHNVPLAGGDTSESPSDAVLADIVLLGGTPTGQALRRSTGRPGDLLYVTGALGGAAAELQPLLATPPSEPRPLSPGPSPHYFPQPRLAVGQALLRRRLATAAMDLSDGLSTDLTHLCEASNVAAEIDETALPLHPLTQTLLPDATARLHAALHGGEDYELLFTARPGTKLPRSIAGVPITCIGRITDKLPRRPLLTLISTSGKSIPLKPQGWEHLR